MLCSKHSCRKCCVFCPVFSSKGLDEKKLLCKKGNKTLKKEMLVEAAYFPQGKYHESHNFFWNEKNPLSGHVPSLHLQLRWWRCYGFIILNAMVTTRSFSFFWGEGIELTFVCWFESLKTSSVMQGEYRKKQTCNKSLNILLGKPGGKKQTGYKCIFRFLWAFPLTRCKTVLPGHVKSQELKYGFDSPKRFCPSG